MAKFEKPRIYIETPVVTPRLPETKQQAPGTWINTGEGVQKALDQLRSFSPAAADGKELYVVTMYDGYGLVMLRSDTTVEDAALIIDFCKKHKDYGAQLINCFNRCPSPVRSAMNSTLIGVVNKTCSMGQGDFCVRGYSGKLYLFKRGA